MPNIFDIPSILNYHDEHYKMLDNGSNKVEIRQRLIKDLHFGWDHSISSLLLTLQKLVVDISRQVGADIRFELSSWGYLNWNIRVTVTNSEDEMEECFDMFNEDLFVVLARGVLALIAMGKQVENVAP